MTPEERKVAMEKLRERFAYLEPIYESIRRRMLEAVPEIVPLHDAFMRDDARWEPYMFFGLWLWPYTLVLIETGDDDEQVQRILDLMEEMLSSDDPSIRALAGIEFIELIFGDGVSGLVWHRLGTASRWAWLEDAMGRVIPPDRSLTDESAYRGAWRQEVDSRGGVPAISVRDAYDIRESLIRRYPEREGSWFRNHFRNWDTHSFLKENLYRERLRQALEALGLRDDWHPWLSKFKDAREALLNDPDLQLEPA